MLATRKPRPVSAPGLLSISEWSCWRTPRARTRFAWPNNWPGSDGVQDDDVDNDGLPDEWEARELLTFALDGTVDTDQDGFTNGEEEANGTDPLLPEAVTIDPDLLATDGMIRLAWSGVPGETYAVETTTNLLSGSWTLEQIVETGDSFQVHVDLPKVEQHAFFRVRKRQHGSGG